VLDRRASQTLPIERIVGCGIIGKSRSFRFPKLCTVARMRRRYPGHKSYGPGKLCELYGIELGTHHRALCDARATGDLLDLMNLKRESCEPDRADKAT
jgi:DNA polymerase-3 subunit epsilon